MMDNIEIDSVTEIATDHNRDRTTRKLDPDKFLALNLTESKTVEVSVRDARKANDIASDMFRGEYKTDGSNTFVFKKSDAADDFRAELEKQRIELLEETKPKSGDREAYKKFFNKTLKKFGADSLADLDDDKQKEFFNYVDKNWESEDEKNESVQIDEKSLARKINKMLSFTADKPDEMRREIGKMSDDELLKLKGAANENPGSGSARKLQIDLINREMKKRNLKESYITEKLKPSDDVSTWIEDFYKSDAPQFKGKNKEERREMAVAAWLEARREAGYDVDKNPNE